MFTFLRSCPTVFQRVCTILYSHQWCMSIPGALLPWQHLIWSVFLSLAILICVWLSYGFICISLVINDDHLFMCLFAICIFPLGEMSVQIASPLKKKLGCCFLWLSYRNSLYVLHASPLWRCLQICFLILWLAHGGRQYQVNWSLQFSWISAMHRKYEGRSVILGWEVREASWRRRYVNWVLKEIKS